METSLIIYSIVRGLSVWITITAMTPDIPLWRSLVAIVFFNIAIGI